MKEHPHNAPLYPETERFMEWYNSEKEKGLLDVKFFAHGAEGTTAESFFGEVNRAITAEASPDSEFF